MLRRALTLQKPSKIRLFWASEIVQVQSKPIIPSHPKQSSSKSKFPLCFPVFLNSPIPKFSYFFPFPFSFLEIPLFHFPLPFPFLKPILFSSSLFQISHFSFKYKGFKDFFNFNFHDFILIKSRMKPYEKRKIGVKIGKEKERERFSSFSLFVLFSLF